MSEEKKYEIRKLRARGLGIDEISKIVDLPASEIEAILREIYSRPISAEEMKRQTIDFYDEIQHDLDRIIYDEFKKEPTRRDTKIIMDALRFKAELQEQKVKLVISSSLSSNLETEAKKLVSQESILQRLRENVKFEGNETNAQKVLKCFSALGMLDNVDGLSKNDKLAIAEFCGVSLYSVNDVVHRVKYHRLGEMFERAEKERARSLKEFLVEA